MSNSGLRHVALKTRNLVKTERFYTGILGMKVAFRVPPNMIFFRTAGANDLLNFVKTDRPIAPRRGLDHIGFKVSSRGLKRLEAVLKKNRVPIEGRRGGTALYIRDPNGYSIEYYCD